MLQWEPEKYTALEEERMKECLEIVSEFLQGKGTYKSLDDWKLNRASYVIKGCHLKVIAQGMCTYGGDSYYKD